MADARTIAFYDGAADRYDALTNKGAPDQDLSAFIALMPAGARVLDLGCGPARASAHMRDAGLAPDPVDASTGMVKLANQTHDIGARLMRFDDLDTVSGYDGVWANFSLLHAPRADLPRHLRAIATALKPQGILHIGMKTGTGVRRDALDRHYTFVTIRELTDLVTGAGMTVLATREGRDTGCAGTIDDFVIMRARKDG